MWIGLIHGPRVITAIKSSMQTLGGDGPELVFGVIARSFHRFKRIALDLPNDAAPYSHFMNGDMYYGELRGGSNNEAYFQQISVDNIGEQVDYIRPTWSTALQVDLKHDWFRMLFSLQAIGSHWEWLSVEADYYKQAYKLLWYFPSSLTFHDVSNMSESAFSKSVLVVHLDSMDITYYAYYVYSET